MTTERPLNRDILRLAVPALGALIAEPLFLIVDSALVGHLGVTPLAGLGIASAVLQTIVGLMVFLAYSTTPAVARRFGAGDLDEAVSVGIDGMWLALGDRRRARPRRLPRDARSSSGSSARRPRSRSRPRSTSASRCGGCPRCSSCSPRRASCAACRTR